VLKHQIHFVPGCAELAIRRNVHDRGAVTGGEQERLPPALLQATFRALLAGVHRPARWQETMGRVHAYELRIVGTFVRLGWRARGQQLLDYS